MAALPPLSSERRWGGGDQADQGQQGATHRWNIGWTLATLLLLAGCTPAPRYGGTAGPDAARTLAQGPPIPLEQLWLMERAGTSPRDTVVAFTAADGRVIVLRHPAPDNATFAVITVPPDSTATGTTTLTLAPAPGRYGLTITAQPQLPARATLRFSYAAHFMAPADALARYRTLALLEQALGMGYVAPAGKLTFVAATRPAADMLLAPLAAAGTWYLAARR